MKKGAGKKEVEAIEKKLYREKSTTGFNAKKYNGVLKMNEEPLSIQKRLRDEWERNIGWYEYIFILAQRKRHIGKNAPGQRHLYLIYHWIWVNRFWQMTVSSIFIANGYLITLTANSITLLKS